MKVNKYFIKISQSVRSMHVAKSSLKVGEKLAETTSKGHHIYIHILPINHVMQ
jgi:hypothetical protein